MTQQGRRKAVRMLLALGAPLVVAVAGVSMGLAGGTARADNGQSIILGTACFATGTNCENGSTQVEDAGTGDVFDALATNGSAALFGRNDTNASSFGGEVAGVYGIGVGAGVDGVYGLNNGPSSANGVFGQNDGTGNGVRGETVDSTASGVYGQNDASGYGVAGRAASGTGVLGDSANGVGVQANSASGTALEVTGTARFSRSGVATVAGTSLAPKNSVQVSLPITSKSMMTATLQKFVAGVFVVAAVPNVSGGFFTIYLNKAVKTSVGPIAWIVTEQP